MGNAVRDELMPAVDVAVIGSGVAGLFLAHRCVQKGLNVALITKKNISTSNTNWAQGGIAGVLDPDDEDAIEAHVKDTLSAGAGLCDEKVVRSVVLEASDRIRDLIEHGVRFDKNKSGEFDKVREGGHSDQRILHSKDATGAEIERALTKSTSGEIDETFAILENWMAIDLIHREYGEPEKGVVGVWCLAPSGIVHTLPAKAIVLATGGVGHLYRSTTNPSIATGDGVGMALRAGADIKDIEFIQFHPTSLAISDSRPFLITEAMRGYGAILMTNQDWRKWRELGRNDPENYSFMNNYSKRGALDTRDVVARAIDSELKKNGDKHVLLITEHLDKDELINKFPNINEKLLSYGITLGLDPIPVIPAAHYMVGGVRVDHYGHALVNGEEMPGLYAIGEVARTGLHGANRLASNSLLEAVVYSERAAANLIQSSVLNELQQLPENIPLYLLQTRTLEHSPLRADLDMLRTTMTMDVGIVKSNARLKRAERKINHLEDEVRIIWESCKPTQDLVELTNLIQIAKLVVRASLDRKENIGLHYNQDLE
ncbi:MAG: L-aspartate oxidase [Candidatus Poseidoniales archaeon]|jgi:L-aspartate oxidase|nr:L-aspartate oxidase [Candidatus Poseidoniales archaeon]|tara:strand:+ start:2508 stop:4136 length:1629 start_codon:yes stop_codon:yes gene_type:complete